jgi:hypothetical protein
MADLTSIDVCNSHQVHVFHFLGAERRRQFELFDLLISSEHVVTVRSFTTTFSLFAGVKTMRTTNTSSPGNCFSTVSGVVGCLMGC